VQLAVLFWYYKNPALCRNRLRVLRRHNPHIPVFGLFGGDPSDAAAFASASGAMLDDTLVYDGARHPPWKWRNGDLMIADWYRDRGRELEWDTLLVVQWDMLVCAPLDELFRELGDGELLVSNIRRVDELDPTWYWIGERREEFETFVSHVRSQGYQGPPLACQFVVAALPRPFLEAYGGVQQRELGFLEYRLPTYARMFGIPFSAIKGFDCFWPHDPATRDRPEAERVLRAGPSEIPLRRIRAHLGRADGSRMFHPFERTFPVDASSRIRFATETAWRPIGRRLGHGR